MSHSIQIIAICCLALCSTVLASALLHNKIAPKATVTVQATNTTKVPSVTYVVDAVQSLEEAYSIYDNDEDRAALYAALFEEKHNGTWNVLVGYTAFYIHAEIYVETKVSTGGKGKKDDPAAEVLYLIFSSV